MNGCTKDKKELTFRLLAPFLSRYILLVLLIKEEPNIGNYWSGPCLKDPDCL